MFKYFNTLTLKPSNLILYAIMLLFIDFLYSLITGEMVSIDIVAFLIFLAFMESSYPSNKPKDHK